jgi:tripartite-type tricarboxylate transporter receptor subunit TctC
MMSLPRRKFLQLTLGVAAVSAPPLPASAEDYPNRYVRLVVPFPPGGTANPIARLLAGRLGEVWGQQMIVENKGGAAGNVAAHMVVQSAPDGYTVLMATSSLATNPFIYPSIGFDAVADLAPITLLCVFPSVLTVPNSSTVRTLKEFIGYAKANPGKLSFASPGVGTPSHLSGELLKREAGIEMTHIPYRGAGPAFSDLISGRIPAMFSALPGALPHIRSGTIRAIAVTSAKRSPFAPNVPTIAEEGFSGFSAAAWYALFAPARTPKPIINKLHDDVSAALEYPAVKSKLEQTATQVETTTPIELAAYLKSEMEKWGPIIKQIGIKPT